MGDLFDQIEDLLDFAGDDDDVLATVESCGDESGPLMIPPLPESVPNELLGGGCAGKDSLEGFIDQNQKSVDEKISTEEGKQSPVSFSSARQKNLRFLFSCRQLQIFE